MESEKNIVSLKGHDSENGSEDVNVWVALKSFEGVNVFDLVKLLESENKPDCVNLVELENCSVNINSPVLVK